MTHNLVPHFILEQFKQRCFAGEFAAATIFIDISGFTPLTVALMQHARAGAEALADALRTVHAPFVQTIYQHGGFIPFFAGDGITAIFPVATTPNSAALAAAATAEAIRQLVGAAGMTVQTRFGDFTIGVKLGLAYGPVQWGIPGHGERYAFYLRGPAIDGCAHAEQQAQQGQILADAAILPFLAAYATLAPQPDSPYVALLRCEVDVPPNAVRPPAPSRAQLAPFIAPAILDLPVRAELREACVVFLTFVEPARQAALDEFVATVLQAAHQFGGEVNQVDFGDQGGLIILLFGAPLAREQVVERTAECLLALRQTAAAITWRAGVTFGTLWAGFRGGPERMDYGATGLVMNMASRMAQKATWGETWVDEAVYTRLTSGYHLDALGTMLFKGRTEAQPIYALRRRREVDAAQFKADTRASAADLIGRARELTRLQQWLQVHLATAGMSVLTIQGEAGIGKSRLAAEARRWLTNTQPVRWLTCPADAILRQSLHPFRVALRHYFGQRHGQSPAANQAAFDAALQQLFARLAALGATAAAFQPEIERTRAFLGALLELYWADSLYATLEPELRFANTLAAISALLHAEALLQPVVLHLEDCQWFDDDSLAQLQHLLRQPAAGPLAVIATRRDGEDAAVSFTVEATIPQQTLHLTYLAQAAVQQQAQQVLGAPLTGAAAHFLATKTNGNPYFVEQLALELQRRDLLQPNRDGCLALLENEAAILPTTLTQVLVARLDRLPMVRKQVVQTAAVLGRDFALPVLQAMLPDVTNWEEQMALGVREQLWSASEADHFTFHHALLRDAAYDMQLRARLRTLHQQAGATMEQIYHDNLAPHAGALAHHYDQAEAVATAVHWYGQAGEQALQQYANEAAARYFRRGLALAPAAAAATRYPLLLGSEAAHNWLGQRTPQQADLADLETATAALQDDGKRSEVWLRKTALQLATGQHHAAGASAARAAAYAQAAGDGLAQARAYHRWGRTYWQAGNYEAAIPRLEKALTLTLAYRGPREEAQCLYDLAVVAHYREEYDEALTHLQKALAVYRALQDGRGESICRSLWGVILNLTGNSL
ncbi:MAG: AAA family ATPase, partial [Caldilineaceae bacterium]